MEYNFNNFGSNLFDENKLKERLSKKDYSNYVQVTKHNQELDPQLADKIATQMKDWALQKGCTHYTHWFHPLTGSTAEKHNSFIDKENNLAICKFSGKALIKDEPDASSFPSGGLRATFEARGYTYWDVESPAFVRGHVLYIPTIFVSYTGESLDTKGPLLKSIEVISDASCKVFNLFSTFKTTRIMPCTGLEQEYFLVDKKSFLERRDLYLTGKTLFGALPPKSQELEKHYYGSIPSRVNDFMEEVNKELWDLGIYAKTEHNETAPGQFELTPIFSSMNIAIDQNMLIMDVLQKIALEHNFVCLLHEKPYDGVNGSGKHNNYSLLTDHNENPLAPGKDTENDLRFLLFMSAFIEAIDNNAELLRLFSSDPGNDYRLGGDEAPPAIISIYLGEKIESIFEYLESGKRKELDNNDIKKMVTTTLSKLPKDNSDRNRTSPIAFTGNKFEFRMLGSSLNASMLNVIINIGVGDSLNRIYEELKDVPEKKLKTKAYELIASIYKKHKRILYSGNGYSSDWINEAKQRGLSNIPTFLEAIDSFKKKESIALFEKYHLFTPKEIDARSEIMYQNYYSARSIEIRTMIAMIHQNLIPSALKELHFITSLPNEYISKSTKAKAKNLVSFIDECNILVEEIERKLVSFNKLESTKEKGFYILENILPLCNKLRKLVDTTEAIISIDNKAYPSYEELFFNIEY